MTLKLWKELDQPQEMHPEFVELGTTIGFLVCLIKKLWCTGKIVVIESEFCIL